MAVARTFPAWIAVWALIPSSAQAAKLEGMQRWLADGKCSEVVERIDDWESKAALGSEDYELRRIRAQAAFCQAKSTDSLASWSGFVARFGDWPEATEGKARLYDLAFSAAQIEGTAAGMLAYIKDYPSSPHLAQARAQEEAWAFEDAAKSGDPRAIEQFLAAHPQTSLREQAWEAMVQTTPGIYLITPAGEPHRIEPIPIQPGEAVELPAGLPVVEAFPVIGVNTPGAGRGETSEWWKLEAVRFDDEGTARLSPRSPLEAVLHDRLGLGDAPTSAGLLDLVAAPGSHLARVATTKNPLAVAQHCTGFTRFALTLRSPGTQPVAYPFAVDCPTKEPVATPLGLLIGAMDAAEAGQRTVSRQRYDSLLGRADAEGLNEWLLTSLSRDPRLAVSEDHPGVGDWVVWTRAADGSELSRWLRVDNEAVRILATRPGWIVATESGLSGAAQYPNCQVPHGSLGGTLFCTEADRPRPVAVAGSPMGWDLPSAEVFAAAGISPAPDLEAVVSVAPRWSEGLRGVWRVRTGKSIIEVSAEAPLAWVNAVSVPPALAVWLQANAANMPIGLSQVAGNAWAAWRGFGG